MWFTIGYAIASGLGTYFLRGPGILIPAAVCLGLALEAFRFREQPIPRRAAAVLLGCAVGCAMFFAYDAWKLAPARAMDGERVPVTIRVTGYSWDTEYGSAADGVTELAGRAYKVRFYLNERQILEPGDTVELEAQLRLTDEGGSREPTFHRTSGILLLAYPRGDASVSRGGETGLRELPARWRQRLLEIIEGCFP